MVVAARHSATSKGASLPAKCLLKSSIASGLSMFLLSLADASEYLSCQESQSDIEHRPSRK